MRLHRELKIARVQLAAIKGVLGDFALGDGLKEDDLVGRVIELKDALEQHRDLLETRLARLKL